VIAVELAVVTATSPPPFTAKIPRGFPSPLPFKNASSSALAKALAN